jgi:hypothetical protein
MFKGLMAMSSLGFLVALALTLMDDRIFRIQSLRTIGEADAILATIPRAKVGAK